MTLSIRARLTVWYTAVVVVVLVAVAVTVTVLHERLALRRFDEEIARLMLTLKGVVHTEFDEGHALQSAANEARIEVAAPDRVLALTDAEGRLLAIWGKPLESPWHPSVSQFGSAETTTIGASRGRALAEPGEYEGQDYIAYIWAPLEALEAENRQLRHILFVSVGMALGVAGLGGLIVGRQTLRPLTGMATQARAMTAENPVDRLTAPHPTDELGTLATAFNGLLDRLSGVLTAQRQFMADASHELRTPVSIVRSTAQVTLSVEDRPADDYRESMTIVGEQADRLSHLVEAMFLLARAEAHGLPLAREVVYLDEILADCARSMRVLAHNRGVRIEAQADDDLGIVGDDRLLHQMVGNLADNAIRHASTRVVLTAHRAPDAIEIRVADDGTGVLPEDREQIFQRFVRRSAQYTGAGLGLPIAKWIAEAHGGQLVLHSSGPTGSVFVARLPRGEGREDA